MITETIEYDDEVLARVREFATSADSADVFWSDEKTNKVRKAIKDHYKSTQGFKCPYCQQTIFVDNGRAWDIDHVACKSEYPRYLFEPQNLCVACIDCNVAKLNKKVIVGAYSKKYPTVSSRFNIVHPHFDKYSDHIAKSNFGFYISITKKGERTYEICNLARFITKFAGNKELSLIPKALEILDFVMAVASSDEVDINLSKNLDEFRKISISVTSKD